MIAVYNPFSGETPEAMAKAIANGRATIPTIIPAIKSLIKSSLLYPLSVEKSFGLNIMSFWFNQVINYRFEFLKNLNTIWLF